MKLAPRNSRQFLYMLCLVHAFADFYSRLQTFNFGLYVQAGCKSARGRLSFVCSLGFPFVNFGLADTSRPSTIQRPCSRMPTFSLLLARSFVFGWSAQAGCKSARERCSIVRCMIVSIFTSGIIRPIFHARPLHGMHLDPVRRLAVWLKCSRFTLD